MRLADLRGCDLSTVDLLQARMTGAVASHSPAVARQLTPIRAESECSRNPAAMVAEPLGASVRRRHERGVGSPCSPVRSR
ncbi:hypothetical protein ABWI09_23725 [Streptomyces tuirus]